MENALATLNAGGYLLDVDRKALSCSLDFTSLDALDVADRLCDFLQVAPKTRTAYRKNIEFFLGYLEREGISHPTSQSIKNYQMERLNAGKKPATINLALVAIRQLFSFLSSVGLYPNIAHFVKKIREVKAVKRLPLSLDQARSLIAEEDGCSRDIDALRDRAIDAVLLETGIRGVSLREAKIRDFQRYGEGYVLFIRNKGEIENSDMVRVPDTASKAIETYLEARGNVKGDAYLFASLCHRNLGGQLSEAGLRAVVTDSLKSKGLKTDKISVHSLRHTAATLMLNAGVPIERVQVSLLHKNIQTTMQYLHFSESAENAPTAILDRYINKNKGENEK